MTNQSGALHDVPTTEREIMHLGQHTFAAGLALTMGASVLAVAAPSQAAPQAAPTSNIDYACKVGDTTFTLPATWDSDAAAEAFYGSAPGFMMGLTLDGTLPAPVAKELYDAGGRSFAGRLDPADNGVTVHEAADKPGPLLSVEQDIASTNLGDQSTATPVPFKVASVRFGIGRTTPGRLTYKAAGFTALLKVTQQDTTVKDVSVSCKLPGEALVIDAVDWIASTTTTVSLSETIAEYGESVAVRPIVTPAAGTAAGTLTVSSGGLDTKVAVNGAAPAVNLRDLPVGTYQVATKFDPTDAVYFRGSTAATTALKVAKARSRMAVTMRGKTTRRPTRSRVDVSGIHGTSPTGKVKFVLRSVWAPATKKFRGKVLSGGDAVVHFGRLAKGRYKLTITYRGDNEHERVVQVRTFNVRR